MVSIPEDASDHARSAWRVALRRAAHQLFDDPVVFLDPFAVPLLGEAGAEALRRTPRGGNRRWSRSLRALAVARSCFAEEQLALFVARGLRQYCLLGAGLDTFPFRNPWPHLRVVEVDHPSMLRWKRQLMREACISLPSASLHQPGDLAHLPDLLGNLEPAEPAFFSMLGVAPYLGKSTLGDILRRVLAHGPGSGIVFDYRLPRALLAHEEQRQHDSLASRLQARGEPFLSSWSPDEIAAALGPFSHFEQLDASALNARYFADRPHIATTGSLAILGEASRLAVA